MERTELPEFLTNPDDVRPCENSGHMLGSPNAPQLRPCIAGVGQMLVRFVDDYLFVSTSLRRATAFLERMLRGNAPGSLCS